MAETPPDLKRMFIGTIPRFYDDLLGPAWFGKYGADLVRRLPTDPGGDVLELACGTGAVTRPLRERLDPRRRLVATDINGPMLEYARGKMPGLDITWQTADAGKLPFGDGEFAAAACSFGVMFVPDKQAAFAEAHRVLRPGGLFLFNVWDRIEENACMRIYSEVVEGLFPDDAELRFRVPYQMYDEALLRGLLDGAGFRLQRLEKVPVTVEGVTAREVATGQVRGTPRGLLLTKRGIDLDLVIDKVTAALESAGGAGRDFRLPCRAIAVEALAG
jgi:SAM-dependent methyltransferase